MDNPVLWFLFGAVGIIVAALIAGHVRRGRASAARLLADSVARSPETILAAVPYFWATARHEDVTSFFQGARERLGMDGGFEVRIRLLELLEPIQDPGRVSPKAIRALLEELKGEPSLTMRTCLSGNPLSNYVLQLYEILVGLADCLGKHPFEPLAMKWVLKCEALARKDGDPFRKAEQYATSQCQDFGEIAAAARRVFGALYQLNGYMTKAGGLPAGPQEAKEAPNALKDWEIKTLLQAERKLACEIFNEIRKALESDKV